MTIEIPAVLNAIPNPPKTLYATGVDMKEILQRPRVAIVGSRKVSTYGKNTTAMFAAGLARQGVVIISGLAFGVDALAHKAALEAGGLTVAVLPTGLDKIYPASHHQLASQITRQGVLMSEYPDGTKPFKGNFIARNRLVSGLSDAVLITEATENSGTLHTARFAIQQNRKIFAVPGNITSPTSKGTNQLIKAGAVAATSPDDVITALGLKAYVKPAKPQSDAPHEQIIIDLLHEGITNGPELLAKSSLGVQAFNQTLTILEITGVVRSLGSNEWTLA